MPVILEMKLLSTSGLLSQLWQRVKVGFWLKTFGVPCFMAVFFTGYFFLLNHRFTSVTVMPLTVIDDLVPYQPLAWLPYVSLWAYVQLPPSMINDRRELVLYGWVAAVVSLIGFAFFLFWPTAVPAFSVDPAGAPALANIKNLDTTGNSCPSLHVTFAVFSAVWIQRHLQKARWAGRLKLANIVWCVAIIYSTLATKQHVFWDVCAGVPLGFAGAAVQARFEGVVRRRQVVHGSGGAMDPLRVL